MAWSASDGGNDRPRTKPGWPGIEDLSSGYSGVGAESAYGKLRRSIRKGVAEAIMSKDNSQWARIAATVLVSAAVVLTLRPAAALAGERLIATGGVTQIEGAAGGGLVPWALIAGYGTRDEVGFTAFYTHLHISDFKLQATGVAIGIYDRLEVSLAKQRFGLGSTVPGESISQEIVGLKLKLAGDAVFDQDTFLPQVAVGLQYKNNRDFTIPRLLGAKKDSGVDFYIVATKLHLAALAGRNLLWNVTARATKANQLGLLGFGGDRNDDYKLKPEGSVALFVTDRVAIGFEYRAKPDNLNVFGEDNFRDAFIAFAPDKRFSVTAAYAKLGNIADKRNQNGLYLSGQLSF